jgi:hypothetical protein
MFSRRRGTRIRDSLTSEKYPEFLATIKRDSLKSIILQYLQAGKHPEFIAAIKRKNPGEPQLLQNPGL